MYHFTGELEDQELRAELEASYDLRLVEVSGKRPNGKSWSKFKYRYDVNGEGGLTIRYQECRIPTYPIY
jgi:hypothetical protein